MKNSMNNHYNGTFVEPNGRRSQRGYGIEVLEQFAREVAFVKNSTDPDDHALRLKEIQALNYNDISADRQTVATVQAMEAILEEHAAGNPNCIVNVNDPQGGLVMYSPGVSKGKVLYDGQV